MSASLVNSLARVYDPNPLHSQKPGGRKLSFNGSDKSQSAPSSSSASPSSSNDAYLRCMENRIDSLSSQMEHLLNMQQTVLTQLDSLSQDVRSMGQDLARMREGDHEGRRGSVAELCREIRGAVQKAGEHVDSHSRRLDGVEKLMEGTQQVISFIGEVVKSSRLVDLLFKQSGNKSRKKTKDDKAKLSLKGLKAQKKRKPQESSETSSLNEAALPEQVKKLNRQNTENSQENSNAGSLRQDDRGRQEPAELILDGSRTTAVQPDDRKKVTNHGEEEGEEEEEDGNIFGDSESEEEKQDAKVEDDGKRKHKEKTESSNLETSLSVTADICPASRLPQQSSEEADVAACSKRRVTEEDLGKDELKKSRVDGSKVAEKEGEPPASKSEEVKTEVEKETEDKPEVKELILDLSPPPLAPFDHRIVTPKPHQISSYYTINRDEVLGGGRFGQVHKCMENSSGLMLAAKIIKARSQKEKEVVRNEIQVMNQLNHANLIQLYAAFESRHDFILVMEYVEGGELFDRIIDENYNLTELDTVLFIRQICEGLRYMHKMYILHLDLKPENILCINRATNKIKIIDFGLARRYKPREKLKWNFEEEEFKDISDEAKDFITRLLVKSKSWRMSATESLRHPWLSDQSLHYQLNQKKTKCRSSHSPPPES
ncbi:hypothetical protein fugu_006381 [Takifugu bimaculatus]|uniref:Protein kinase domain-containing protein n=1 Tax=Takifugu bimaculatus TaxID=433685 RepID=A0A4Z2BAU4_9TELE|nr:hypothetical protein fugu_006381 [Takifugu bimaculatus]